MKLLLRFCDDGWGDDDGDDDDDDDDDTMAEF